ncbi:MAG TPA: acyl-CoA dehydrogenase family protein [Acidimicrobiales bacterium]|nr:acyl-CoA dehydrogenase family protein [Acidimicrobiales bacterium]
MRRVVAMAGAGGADLLEETEDQAALRRLARDVAAREVGPRAAAHDESGEVPWAAVKALAAADLFGVTVGERWGGLGLGDVEAAIVLEEVARHDVSTAVCCQLAFNGPPRGIEHLGPPAMQDRWLPAVADGEAIISIGITEPDAGSAVQSMRSALVADGPGRWRLQGYKNYSTLGHAAAAVLVWCRWPGGDGARGLGAVVVPTDRDGVELTGRHRGMGIHAATESEVAFDGVEITADDVLVEGDPSSTEPFKVLLAHLNHERCGNAAMCVGAAQGALEHSVRYMHERVIGGHPIAELQGLQWKLADMVVELESARLLLGRAVRLAGAGGTPPALETAMAKLAANLAAKRVCDEAMQIHGGYGYSREYPLERAYRDIRGLCIGAGTVEAQRNYIGSNVARGATTSSPGWQGPDPQ